MTKNSIFTLLLCVLCYAQAYSQASNTELEAMANADQSSRAAANIDWHKLNMEDSVRRDRVIELLKTGAVVTAKDHFNVGIIFQHGNDTLASSLAVKSFKTAIALDSTLNRWWYAAAVDRDLMRRNLPQIYGTQYIKGKNTDGKWQRYTIDTTQVTDAERQYYRVETLAAQRDKERMMNLQTIPDYYKQTQSIDKTIVEVKHQYHQGGLSAYNISEDAINSFGYSLLKQDKKEDALKIFKLNTELYPNAANTYDSYGEILLLLGQKKKAKKAYAKSLKLNPQNENAKTILKSL